MSGTAAAAATTDVGTSTGVVVSPPVGGGTPSATTEEEDNNSSTSSSSSSSSSYHDDSTNDLTVLSCAGLLLADCMGTGILALPNDVRIVLGDLWGVCFVLLNLPINAYAGYILSESARSVEVGKRTTSVYDTLDRGDDGGVVVVEEDAGGGGGSADGGSGEIRHRGGGGGHHGRGDTMRLAAEEGGEAAAAAAAAAVSPLEVDVYRRSASSTITDDSSSSNSPTFGKVNSRARIALPTMPNYHATRDALRHKNSERDDDNNSDNADEGGGGDTASTFDFIGVTSALFGQQSRARTLVLSIYYTNIFLVLGNYILVMSHSVRAILGEDNICIPPAGVVASTLMFGLSQLNTMAKLGRSATVISLTALLVVVVQCLTALDEEEAAELAAGDGAGTRALQEQDEHSVLRKMAALSSIGFAVGSQKLFLNIRHEMADRNKAPQSLAIALTSFGAAYVAVIQMSGPIPPSFLFDSIPVGSASRRLAGLMLWIHVSVSYAINSQALCSSIDRLSFHRLVQFHSRPKLRWAVLTAMVAATSYVVANAIPFFRDLVSLIGALTSVPLTLLLPAVLYRKMWNVPIWFPPTVPWASYGLLVFASCFLVCGLFGAISSIEIDWAHHGPPFACS